MAALIMHSVRSKDSLAERCRHIRERATSVVAPAGRYVVVAPHPDDEVLTVGGLIAQLVSAGAAVTVVGVTDGGNAYPGDREHDELARTRRNEQAEALERLGVHPKRVESLGIRDGHVAECENEVAAAIARHCTPVTTVIAPWVHDVHADHEAVGRAAQQAASSIGCSVWYSLFWAWHQPSLTPLESVDLISVELDPEVQTVKAAALTSHASQIRPVGIEAMLTPARLEPATWTSEYFVVDTPADASR